uniref:Putative secreted protein n=1 Tax=Anopheles triannulatus TaxID=58253 RepID=A0A2M4B240_9DIPT
MSSKVVLLLNAAFGSLKLTSRGSRAGGLEGSWSCCWAALALIPAGAAAATEVERHRRPPATVPKPG